MVFYRLCGRWQFKIEPEKLLLENTIGLQLICNEMIYMAEIQANMAGTIAEVLVNENDTVSSGQDVIILESMKMHIPIQATQEGTVKEVKVNKGDFVNAGHILLIVE